MTPNLGGHLNAFRRISDAQSHVQRRVHMNLNIFIDTEFTNLISPLLLSLGSVVSDRR